MSVSIQRRQTGRGISYVVRWRENGKQSARTFDRRADADTFELEVRRRKQLGPAALAQLTTPTVSLDEWVTTRWAPQHGATLAPATRDTYASIYATHIAADLGPVPLGDLTVGRLRQWQDDRLANDIGPAALAYARALLSGVLRHAAESEAIASNPMSLVRAPKKQKAAAVTPLAPATIEAMRANLQARDSTLISVLAYAGLRPGEALRLRWEHIGARTLLVTATKRDARPRRSVRLLAPLAADLAAWRLTQGRPHPTALVFPNPDGNPWTASAYKSWARPDSIATVQRGDTIVPKRAAGPFHRALTAAGSTGTPYTLRHSFASLLLAEGRTVHEVAEQLGHSAEMTLNVYGHVIAEFADRTDRVDAEHEIRVARGQASERKAG